MGQQLFSAQNADSVLTFFYFWKERHIHTHTENIDMKTVYGAFTASLNSYMPYEEVLLLSFYRVQTFIQHCAKSLHS